MAFGTDSKIFVYWINDTLEKTISPDMNTGGDTFKVALYGNSGTPDSQAAANVTGYNTGAWVTANEISDTTEWPAGGQALGSVDLTVATNVITWDAADETSDGTSATLTDVYGVLIYDDTLTTPVADQGVCYLYLGGAQSVTDGTFVVQFHTSGVFTITL